MKPYNELRIVFFGTPDFAAASLQALVEAGCNIAAVVTAPDKPAGRGLQPQVSAVKSYALSAGLPLLQPEKLKAPDFLAAFHQLEPDLGVVVAFRMLPEAVWNYPPMGTINVHGSLLPQYRGAAPIHWAVINGESETGVTTFRLKHEIDTGDILLQQKEAIRKDDTTGSLYARLMSAGAKLLVETVKGLAAGVLRERPQDAVASENLKHARKIHKEDGNVHWNNPVQTIQQLVLGLSPQPGAYTQLQGKTLRIHQSSPESSGRPAALPGTVETDGKTYLRFAAADGWLNLLEVQQEGKKRMDTEAFLRGFRIQPAQ